MRQQTEKPSEPVMRFFTPDLYLEFNSPNDDEADRADAAWETALKEYQLHLAGIRDQMPSQVKELADRSLHDAEVLAVQEQTQSFFPLAGPLWPTPVWTASAALSLRQDGTVLSLVYLLWDRVRESAARENWPFSQSRKHWLYDEVDVAADRHGMFLHRILFSDGSTLEIPFFSVIAVGFPLPAAAESTAPRQSA